MNKIRLLAACALFFLIGGISFAQPACPSVSVTPGNVTICSGCTTLTATVQGTVATTSYSVAPTAYAPFAFNAGTPILVNQDDIWSGVVALPFCFNFYGTTYNQVVIGANGLISFDVAEANQYCNWDLTVSGTLPTTNIYANSIMGVYQDIDPTYQGNIYWQIVGTAPCRALVVSYYQIPYFGDPNSISTGSCPNPLFATSQIVLYETTNIIDIYIQDKPVCTGWNNGLGVEGIQNATGTAAVVVPGRNNSVWTATNDAYRFTPTGAPQYNLTWYAPPNTAIGTGTTVTVCPTTTTTYTATVVNTTCGGPITVSSVATVTIVGSPATVSSTAAACNSNTGTATITATSGTGPFTYLWNTTPPQNTQTATGLAAGTYTGTVTDATGCIATNTISVAGSGAPTVTTSSTQAACGASNGNATANPSGGTGPYTYSWSPGGQASQTATGLAAGTYSILISDANACTITTTVSITSTNAPTVTTSSTQASCGASNGTATSNPSGGTGAYTYLWSPSGQVSQTSTGLSAGNYTVTVTDASGCTSSSIATVSSGAGPIATAGADISICAGAPNILNAGGGGSYSWSPATNLSNTTISNPVASPTATITYTVTVTDGNGCTSADDVVVAVNPQPVATFSATTVCFNNPTVFTDQSQGTTVWDWNFGDNNTSTQQNPSHTYNAAGNYTVTLIATNSTCKDPIDLPVTVNPLPVANFSAPAVCIGNATCFTDISTIAAPGTITGWNWNFGDPPSGANNISNLQNPCHTFSSAASYNVLLTVTSNAGCQIPTVLVVNVLPPPVAAFTAPAVCLNTSTSFTDASTNATQWDWQFGDGGSSTSSSPSHTYTMPGTYTVTLIALSSSSCSDTTTGIVTVNPLPVVNFTLDSVCMKNVTSFFDLSYISTGNITAWNWNFGDGNTSTLQNPSHTYSSAGTYSVTLTTTAANSCVNSMTTQAIVYALPVAEFLFSPGSTIELDELVSFTDLSANASTWWWNFGDGDTSTTQNPSHVYSNMGTQVITLIVVSPNGCMDTVQHLIEIKDFSFHMPNAFTPNADGINDLFFGKGIGITEYEMSVFDRWGNLIFYCNINDLPQTLPCMWNGKVEAGKSDELVQEDVFVWKVRLTNVFNKQYNYVGSVTIVK